MTPRRLKVIVDQLPPESATKTAIRDSMTLEDYGRVNASNTDPNKHGPISATDMKLIDLIDAVRDLGYIVQMVNADKKTAYKIKRPSPYPRPGLIGGKSAIKAGRQLRMVQELRRDRGAKGVSRSIASKEKPKFKTEVE